METHYHLPHHALWFTLLLTILLLLLSKSVAGSPWAGDWNQCVIA